MIQEHMIWSTIMFSVLYKYYIYSFHLCSDDEVATIIMSISKMGWWNREVQ